MSDTTTKNDNGVIGSGKKAFIAALIAVALNPLSIFMGYYINRILQKPKLSIEYIHILPEEQKLNFSPTLFREAMENEYFLKQFSHYLPFGTINTFKSNSYNREFVNIVTNKLKEFDIIIKEKLNIIDENLCYLNDNTSKSVVMAKIKPIHEMSISRALALVEQGKKQQKGLKFIVERYKKTQLEIFQVQHLVNKLKNGFSSLANKSVVKTGNAEVRVGVLNSGDLDGVLYPIVEVVANERSLFFNSKKHETLSFSSKKNSFTVVKPHSFVELEISISKENSKELVDMWRGLIKNSDCFEFKLHLNTTNVRLEKTLFCNVP